MKSINPKTKVNPPATPRKTYKDVSTDTFAAGVVDEESELLLEDDPDDDEEDLTHFPELTL